MTKKTPTKYHTTKLTIELVPASCWYSNVRSNVSKHQWDTLRHKVYLLAGNKCEVCAGTGKRWPVECHEVWHYDDDNHVQSLVRMIALCPLCHKVKHIGRASITGEYDISVAHLAKVNGWSNAQAREYVNEQFLLWNERSQYDWALDISKLKNYEDDDSSW